MAGAVGLLIYLYLLNHLILIGAALAATSTRGTVIDMAAAPPQLLSPSRRPRPPGQPSPAARLVLACGSPSRWLVDVDRADLWISVVRPHGEARTGRPVLPP